jgi:glucose/arabinose dehydrogenase
MSAMSTTRRLIAVAAAGLVLVTAAACGGDDEQSGAGPTAPPAPVPNTGGPASPAASRPAAVGVPDLGAPEEVSRGIDVPWGLAFLPTGDVLVAERDTGRIVQVPQGGGPARQVYRVPGVDAGGEGGLLGLAVSENFGSDQYVYAYFTAASDNRIVRFRLSGGQPEVIFDGIDKAGNHNGGRIAFGPDGMLYVGTGDAADPGVSQDPDDPNGKILRLTPLGDPAPGNPRPGSPVYSLGHRNVQGLAWDAQGRLFATEFGQNEFDEVNLIQAGRNYGWPEVEGEGDTDGGRYTNPLVTWGTDEASPSGAAIAGNTLYVAALRGERLWAVPLRGDRAGEPRAELRDRYGRLRTVATAPDGSLWVTTSNTDGRGDLRDGDDRILRFPAR